MRLDHLLSKEHLAFLVADRRRNVQAHYSDARSEVVLMGGTLIEDPVRHPVLVRRLRTVGTSRTGGPDPHGTLLGPEGAGEDPAFGPCGAHRLRRSCPARKYVGPVGPSNCRREPVSVGARREPPVA